MAACVLALFVVAPTVGAGVCLCDDTAAIRVAAAETLQGDAHRDSYPCDAACCLGGHCHHGGSMLDAFVPSIPAPIPMLAEHMPAPVEALASRTTSGLDRPPRA